MICFKSFILKMFSMFRKKETFLKMKDLGFLRKGKFFEITVDGIKFTISCDLFGNAEKAWLRNEFKDGNLQKNSFLFEFQGHVGLVEGSVLLIWMNFPDSFCCFNGQLRDLILGFKRDDFEVWQADFPFLFKVRKTI